MGEERDYTSQSEDPERHRPLEEEEGEDVEGHRHRPLQEEAGSESDEPDVEAHRHRPHHRA